MRRGLFTPQRWVPLLVVGVLLGIVTVAASLATPGFKKVVTPAGGDTPPGHAPNPTFSPSIIGASGSPGTSRPGSVMPGWLQAVLGAACVTLVVAFFGAMIYVAITNALARARLAALQVDDGTAEALEERRQAMIDALDQGIAELARDDADPRSAVIICWVRLEEVADAAGTPRAVTDTPTDLVARLLADHQVSTEALNNLAELYRIARYSTSEVSTRMRDRARAALMQLRGELMVSRSGPLASTGPPTGPAVPRPAAPGDRPRPRPGGPA